MNEIGVAREIDGMRFLIEKIETKTDFECAVNCFLRKKDYSGCEVQKAFQIKDKEKTYDAIVITIVATNFACRNVGHVDYKDIIMVDSDGFSHQGTLKCYKSNLPQIEWGDSNTEFLPQTKVRYKVIFPTLAEGLTVSKVLIRPLGRTRNTLSFDIEPYRDAVNDEFLPSQQSDDTIPRDVPIIYPYGNSNYYIDMVQQKFRSLKVFIHSRLTNCLTEKEQINLENKINTESYALKLELDEKRDAEFKAIKKELGELLSNYKSELATLKETNKNRADVETKIEELYSLSPREFEEYTQELLTHMGYENVVLTPYTNDKGIDLFCERNGEKVAVQCKKYKGTVGSPEIISFIGAMSNAHVDSGIFITTGMFSFEAEALATKNPILLINRVKLAKTIMRLLDTTKDLKTDIQQKSYQKTIDFS